MFYPSDLFVIPWNRNPPRNFKGTVLRIESENIPPGFARLRICGKSQRCEAPYYRRPNLLNISKTSKARGPSIASNIEDIAQGKSCCSDVVFSIYCPFWPTEADEWRFRRRNHGWPTEKTIAGVTRGGCHFVSKLRTWDTCDDTEWRFSFSKAEVILIHSWTDVQKYIYHLIRVIKRNISELCDANEKAALQTYFFKILMLWACEENPSEYWIESNVETCVREILGRMVECLIELQCPSYFIPGCNIMAHLPKMKFDKVLTLLVTTIEEASKYIMNVTPKIGPVINISIPDILFKQLCSKYMYAANNPLKNTYNSANIHPFSNCEWFLPEMKYLHNALMAHVCLMSFDDISFRRGSKFYVLCLTNLYRALNESSVLKRIEFFRDDQSTLEHVTEFMQGGNDFKYVSDLPFERQEKRSYEKKMLHAQPSPLYILTTVYKINFYFTALQAFDLVSEQCKQTLQSLMLDCSRYEISRWSPLYVPVLISTSLSKIFDPPMQTILGLLTLCKYSVSMSSNSNFSPETSLTICPFVYLQYVRCQCLRKLRINTSADIFIRFVQVFCRDIPWFSTLPDIEEFSLSVAYAALRMDAVSE